MEKQLLIGNEAIARGLYEAGCRVVSSYPGTPSTEVTETAATYPEIYCEWSPNEKVGVETALGAAIAGARAFSGMKHVGLNVAADPLFTSSYTGINAGMVILVADDPGMHSSQNEQDSRHYAKAAKLMMLEPSDSQECKDYAKLAFTLSEQFDTPVMLRLTTRVAHSRSLVELGDREEVALHPYVKDTDKYVMMPGQAKKRHVIVENRVEAQKHWAETADINTVEDNGSKIGVICAGISYQYAQEALGDKVNYLKLGCVYPLPEKLIQGFSHHCDKVYVLEQLDPFLEEYCKTIGVEVIGKEAFTLQGEYSQRLIRKVILGEEYPTVSLDMAIPPRPPVLCAGCPPPGTVLCPEKAEGHRLRRHRLLHPGRVRSLGHD